MAKKESVEKTVRNIRRHTRKKYSAKIQYALQSLSFTHQLSKLNLQRPECEYSIVAWNSERHEGYEDEQIPRTDAAP